jgi:hypothetical protein
MVPGCCVHTGLAPVQADHRAGTPPAKPTMFESEAFEGVAAFLFTPDGKHVVMQGKQRQSFVFIMEGKVLRLPANTAMQLECLTFSPDGSRYAFFTGGNLRDGGQVYVDGKETGLNGTFNDRDRAAQALLFPHGFGQFASSSKG